ncbi:hypothetical protein BJ912DRAFT_1047706 [Pholiota molesta]|nr:hypothetical protein BJ912DRAFT_1047706 [Pholiota molesta]
MENDDLREALAHSEAAGANEARRLQDILALEHTEHDEKTVELQEQLNAQDDRIRRLEREMNEVQEQAREVDARNCDLKQQLSRHDDVIGKSAAQVEEKDGHIQAPRRRTEATHGVVRTTTKARAAGKGGGGSGHVCVAARTAAAVWRLWVLLQSFNPGEANEGWARHSSTKGTPRVVFQDSFTVVTIFVL